MRVTVPTRGSMNLKANVFFGNRIKIRSTSIAQLMYLYTRISLCRDLCEWIKGFDFNKIIFGFIFRSLVLFSLLQTMTINGVSAVIKFQKA